MRIFIKNLDLKSAVALSNSFKKSNIVCYSEGSGVRRTPANLEVEKKEKSNFEEDVKIEDHEGNIVYSGYIENIGSTKDIIQLIKAIEEMLEDQDGKDFNYWWSEHLEIFMKM